MPELVAIDIETTGLDPKKDAVLEIGAVRFKGRRIEGKWTSLINPGRPIPPFITQLTGITNEMVAHAPALPDITHQLAEFIGHLPVIGHNITFDLNFLRRFRLLINNEYLDTYEMASVLLPRASRYNLGALAQSLTVALPATHRALDDALVTHGIYLRLHEMALDLPIEILNEIVQMSEALDWGGYLGFRFALEERSKQPIRAIKTRRGDDGWFQALDRKTYPPQSNVEQEISPLDPEEIAAILEHGGPLSAYLADFEHRPQQVEMCRAIARAISRGEHLMVEASTGVGKSLAYLIPAALWSLQNNTRVVISTNTINLQDQLIHKDIPDLKAALGLDLRAAVLKGRANYLCPRRLDIMRRRGVQTPEEMRVLAKVLVWLHESGSGDRGELNLNGPAEKEVWYRLSAEDEACTSETCLERTGGACPFFTARQQALGAHLIVVNHALLLSDVATGNRVLPEYDYLIVDEAHHLEDATTNALSYRVTVFDLERLLRELGGDESGLLGWTSTALRGVLRKSDKSIFENMISSATDLAFQFQQLLRLFFDSLQGFLLDQREGQPIGSYGQQVRILPATRRQPAWSEVEACWDEAQGILKQLLDLLLNLSQMLADLIDHLPPENKDLFTHISSLYRRLSEHFNEINSFVFKPANDRIYWVEVQPDGRSLSLNAAPLHIGPMMERYLWHEKTSVILTSATLTAAGRFDYLRERLQAIDADELALGSPFDYENAALLYIPSDIPEPADRLNYQRSVEQALIRLCRATSGRTLVLFTSYAQLRATSQAIAGPLAKDGIVIFEQGEGASSHALLESFRTTDKAVLLGTRAFWEGVDVPGEALSVLVIAKLPFDVPTDPIVAARAETFDDPFYQYSLPEAILRFRQGFGRLIRTQSDRGVVVILDRRVLTKKYGREFLESLPPCTVEIAPLANLPKAATGWLNL